MNRYGKAYDPRSAHEVLLERTKANLKKREQAEMEKRTTKPRSRSSRRQSTGEAFFKSLAGSLGSAVGSSAGRKFFRGVLGSLLK